MKAVTAADAAVVDATTAAAAAAATAAYDASGIIVSAERWEEMRQWRYQGGAAIDVDVNVVVVLLIRGDDGGGGIGMLWRQQLRARRIIAGAVAIVAAVHHGYQGYWLQRLEKMCISLRLFERETFPRCSVSTKSSELGQEIGDFPPSRLGESRLNYES